jgi:hypothetical protein
VVDISLVSSLRDTPGLWVFVYADWPKLVKPTDDVCSASHCVANSDRKHFAIGLNASTSSHSCLQRVSSGECNSHFIARSERNSEPSAH